MSEYEPWSLLSKSCFSNLGTSDLITDHLQHAKSLSLWWQINLHDYVLSCILSCFEKDDCFWEGAKLFPHISVATLVQKIAPQFHIFYT